MKNKPWLLSRRATIKVLMRKKNIQPFQKLGLDLNQSSYTDGVRYWMQAVRSIIGNRMDGIDPRGLNEMEFIETTFRVCRDKEEFKKISSAFRIGVRDEGEVQWKTLYDYWDKVLTIGSRFGIPKAELNQN